MSSNNQDALGVKNQLNTFEIQQMNKDEVVNFARHPETRSFVAVPTTLFISLFCFFLSFLFYLIDGKSGSLIGAKTI